MTVFRDFDIQLNLYRVCVCVWRTYLLCNAQKLPLPGRSSRRGILIKQSLKDKLCRKEFCHF
jgi:hypothetical protein